MNERIQKLAEQAGGLLVRNMTATPAVTVLTGEDIEDFAKLIVEEFRNVLADAARECPIECAGHFAYADEKIAEHFYLEKE